MYTFSANTGNLSSLLALCSTTERLERLQESGKHNMPHATQQGFHCPFYHVSTNKPYEGPDQVNPTLL